MDSYWIDSHCHLEMIEQDTASIIQALEAWQLKKVVTIGTQQANNSSVLKNCEAYPEVYGTYGLHPNHATEEELSALADLPEVLAKNPKICAIGECGFDFFYQHTSYEQQKKAFTLQLEHALALNYPVVIHSRSAEAATIETLEPYLKKGVKAILHSLTSNQELFQFGRAYDLYFSFNGISTYKKSEHLREFLKQTPLERVLLETDAPFLAPGKYRGKTNLPYYVAIVGELLADYLGIKLADFQAITSRNAEAFYRLP